jgi:hypothetical protein
MSMQLRWVMGLLLCLLAMTARAADPPYAAMAELSQYSVPAVAGEVELARSAAPESISADAEVLTLGQKGYETAVHGKNGFVCLVERSWAAGLGDPEFWNPHLRAPICMNPAAARSVLPAYLERTRWVLSGVSRSDLLERTRRAVAQSSYPLPEAGAMAFMLSKQGNLAGAGGHWHPHLMLYMPRIEMASWGANAKGSPVFGAQGDPEPVTTCVVVVPRWSDGAADVPQEHEGH